ncbi:hypothetical protein WSK_1187 [Novosphingobium sp. Rr 2-17]|uniref:hypothetical protein n=1 Tax=Novosphingobium sp. Rr 2-17 TaxID=555793 RepID=UPI000269A7E1|nr:hypothetical protein [Novosphingobium sp. Rr 2-17]EIZ80154.1 hypothetical protein WSK_1187 [Novosphingobium sp. Rr 2-17]
MIQFRRTLSLTAVALVLGLGACSKQPEPAPSESSDVPTEVVAEPDAARTDAPVAAPEASEAVAADVIPPALRGRWGLVAGDCTGPADVAKGLMTVSAGQLKFYEAVANLTNVKSARADAVTGNFDFSGEGQSWTLQVALTSPDGGKTMVRKDTGPDAAPQPLHYKKCA